MPSFVDVRIDAGVKEGKEISMFYDPMICKLVTHGPDRKSAIDKMKTAVSCSFALMVFPLHSR